MVDRDLAELYRVRTSVLNQAVRRNSDRFPDNFMFRLSHPETEELITKCDRFTALKHSSVNPLAFTEYGVAMLSSVLRNRRAVQINIQIIQTFIRLRRFVLAHKELAVKIEELERKFKYHDSRIETIFDAIRRLMTPPEQPRRQIGFQP